MQIITPHQLPPEVRCAATIGFFDGVHRGHRYLISQLCETAVQNAECSQVITFRQHPRQVLQTDYRPLLLLDYEEKLDHLARCGTDYCLPLDFTPQLAALTARQFLTRYLTGPLHVRHLLLGYDHHFGADHCSFKEYLQMGREAGVGIIHAQAFRPDDTAVSSSAIRRYLQAGNVSSARWALGYAYPLAGTVVSGRRVGHSLGYPTANLSPANPFKLIPADGVYAAWAETDGHCHPAMVNIGHCPTFSQGSDRTIEAHLLHFAGNLYNRPLRLHFVSRLREERRFSSPDELRTQLDRDARAALAALQSENPPTP